METEDTTNITARQEHFAVNGRRDKSERAHHASDRRLVHQCCHDHRLGARMARRSLAGCRPQYVVGSAPTVHFPLWSVVRHSNLGCVLDDE